MVKALVIHILKKNKGRDEFMEEARLSVSDIRHWARCGRVGYKTLD